MDSQGGPSNPRAIVTDASLTEVFFPRTKHTRCLNNDKAFIMLIRKDFGHTLFYNI